MINYYTSAESGVEEALPGAFAKGGDDGEACGADEVGAKERESKLSGDVNRFVVREGDEHERRDFPVCEKEI